MGLRIITINAPAATGTPELVLQASRVTRVVLTIGPTGDVYVGTRQTMKPGSDTLLVWSDRQVTLYLGAEDELYVIGVTAAVSVGAAIWEV